MRQKKLVLTSRTFVCPATNRPCLLGAVLLIKPPEVAVKGLDLDDDMTDAVKVAMVEEAERHG
jgi:hypothetical protein